MRAASELLRSDAKVVQESQIGQSSWQGVYSYLYIILKCKKSERQYHISTLKQSMETFKTSHSSSVPRHLIGSTVITSGRFHSGKWNNLILVLSVFSRKGRFTLLKSRQDLPSETRATCAVHELPMWKGFGYSLLWQTFPVCSLLTSQPRAFCQGFCWLLQK